MNVAHGLLALIALCAAPILPAQRPVAPPPQAAERGPALDETVSFIQSKLGYLGEMRYSDVSTSTFDVTESIGGISVNRATGVLSYRLFATFTSVWHSGDPNKVIWNKVIASHGIPFGEITEISVSNVSVGFQDRPVTRITIRTYRKAETLERVVSWDKHCCGNDRTKLRFNQTETTNQLDPYDYLDFSDEELANRVALALNHAAELYAARAMNKSGQERAKEPF